ncbi:BamA/TamA family outer membrane protein, partial [filamentous cyanobacterium LEGE 11480]
DYAVSAAQVAIDTVADPERLTEPESRSSQIPTSLTRFAHRQTSAKDLQPLPPAQLAADLAIPTTADAPARPVDRIRLENTAQNLPVKGSSPLPIPPETSPVEPSQLPSGAPTDTKAPAADLMAPNSGTPNPITPNPGAPNIVPPSMTPATPETRSTEVMPRPTPQPQTPQPQTPQASTPSPTSSRAPIAIVGSTIFSAADFAALLNSIDAETATPDTLQQTAEKITQKYVNAGYLTSRAVVERPTDQSRAQIRVLEGSLETIQVEGNQRLSDRFIQARIERGITTPINSLELEAQLRLLRLNPLFDKVEASLRPGQQAGKSQLIVRVEEAQPLTGGLSFDNYSPPSVGSERINAHIGSRNLTGNGDELGGFYSRTLNGGAESYGLSYKIPLSAQDNTLQLRVERNRNVVQQAPFDALGIRGDGEIYEVSYRHPVIHSVRESLGLSIGLTAQNGQTFTFNTLPTPFGIGPDADGVSRTSVISFGQDYVKRDPQGTWNLRSQFNLGTSLFGATRNSGNIPDGQFFSWTAQAQRIQRLGARHLLVAQVETQLTPNSLLPSQQFLIGGGQSVRGYRQNARAGDNGLRISIEDRITLTQDADGNPKFQIAPFAEAGFVWNNGSNPNPLPHQTNLVSAGLGLIFTPTKNLQARLDYGVPLVNLADRGNNIQDSGLHFRLNYRF